MNRNRKGLSQQYQGSIFTFLYVAGIQIIAQRQRSASVLKNIKFKTLNEYQFQSFFYFFDNGFLSKFHVYSILSSPTASNTGYCSIIQKKF